MHYAEYVPPDDLADDIECFWTLRRSRTPGEPDGGRRVLPDGCVELIVHLGIPFAWRDPRGVFVPQSHTCVVGPFAAPLWLAAPPRFSSVGVRFRPGAARPYFHVPISALANAVTPLELLWGRSAAEFHQRMAGAGSTPHLLRCVAAALRARRPQALGDGPVIRRAVAHALDSRGRARVADLAARQGHGSRRLERGFDRELGLAPKVFLRVVRFNALLAGSRLERDSDWAALAWDHGFADQAHLIREFRALTQVTPGRIGSHSFDLARLFVAPERLAAYFGVSHSFNPSAARPDSVPISKGGSST